MPHPTALDRVYAATTPDELADAYAAWAADYDRETAASGYCLPFLIPAWLARHLPPGAGPVLDAGCGTGLSGPCLKALGYADVEGLDMSPDMLAIAASRGAYSELKRGILGAPLPWPDGHFAAFVSAGVFTAGHAPAAGLHELVRITRGGRLRRVHGARRAAREGRLPGRLRRPGRCRTLAPRGGEPALPRLRHRRARGAGAELRLRGAVVGVPRSRGRMRRPPDGGFPRRRRRA
jgi:SAM-dependent methyltransferase